MGRKWKAPEEPQEQEASLPPAKEAREDTVIYMSTHGDRQWSEAMLSNLLYSQGRVESGNPPAPSCPCPVPTASNNVFSFKGVKILKSSRFNFLTEEAFIKIYSSKKFSLGPVLRPG